MTSDVGAWERTKLRVLNGAHSTLAYIGLLLGHETVADAMNDARLAVFVQRLVLDDIIPSLPPSAIDVRRYAEETFARFRNPAINHRLSQIAWDGSQKLPYRLLDTVANARAAGRPLTRLVLPIAAWVLFLERQVEAGKAILDPLAEPLADCVRSPDAVHRILGLRQIFPEALAADPAFTRPLAPAVANMRTRGVAAAIDVALADAADS